MIKPQALQRGDALGIVAPAGPVDQGELARGVQHLKEMGFNPVLGKSVSKRSRYLAGDDDDRLADFHRMFRDPGIKAVICARGGYGSARILPGLDLELIRRHPKILIGSSDVTLILNYLRQSLGLVTYHGPMVAPNFGRPPTPLGDDWFQKILMGGSDHPSENCMRPEGVQTLSGGKAEGHLVGGCLTLICSSLRTSYEIDTEGSILLLEDINEAPYRIDRMLTQLRAAGKFKNVQGILFGRMPGCQPSSDAGFRLEDVIMDLLSDLSIPILFNFPAGHGGDQVTLPLGIRLRLNGETASVTLLEDAVSL